MVILDCPTDSQYADLLKSWKAKCRHNLSGCDQSLKIAEIREQTRKQFCGSFSAHIYPDVMVWGMEEIVDSLGGRSAQTDIVIVTDEHASARFPGWREVVRPIQSHDIPKTRRTILPLLEERAGVRTVVQTIFVPTPKFTPRLVAHFRQAQPAMAEVHLSLVRGNEPESGAEATALQTLARHWTSPNFAKRLDCGAFTAAFLPAGTRFFSVVQGRKMRP